MSERTADPLIVGLGARVPGARGLDAMWKVLSEGRCTVSTLDERLFDPANYLDPHRTRQGKSYTFAAGQIDDLYDFDPHFFGITPRAAVEMDPQQRLMLQTVWEAVEDACLDIRDLAGDRTGVFVGSSQVEMLPLYYMDAARGGSSFVLGNALSIIANRVSQAFDFGGPSYVVDTACSSSLYALHQAREAIVTGQVDTAIVGGVHVLRSPGGFVGFSQARMLSPTGLCRAFDAKADGYVRSEACISVVLMHPDRAAELQPAVRARLLATGVNADGAAKNLTVPVAARQEALLSHVLAQADRDPEDLDFYEAHGTGTAVGDPTEATALGEAFGTLRREPLVIGAAKTNFGHAEPASGLVGLAKVLLAMEHRTVPASLHYTAPNPDIDFKGLNLRVADRAEPLAQSGTLVAGVSSFGFGGTNAVAILETAEPAAAPLPDQRAASGPPWLLLSAATQGSLAALRQIWSERLTQSPPDEWQALAASAARRSALGHRMAVPLTADAATALNCEAPAILTGEVAHRDARTVFAFPGNGAQSPTMGREAYQNNAPFRAKFDEVAEAFIKAGIGDLRQYLHGDALGAALASPMVAQPMLLACQIAEAHAHQAAGLRPAAVIGHSLGEIAALHIAGAFDVTDAAKIVARRSMRFERLRGEGGMMTIAGAPEDVSRALAGFDDAICIAAINSPNSVTVSGPHDLLDRFALSTLQGKRMASVRLGVEVAYHSPMLDPLEAAFRDDLSDIAFGPLRMPVAGGAAGKMLRSNQVTAEYLWQNSRQPVRFHEALAALAKTQPGLIVEVAPKPVLAANIRDTIRFSGLAMDHIALGAPGESTKAHAALAWVKGADVDRKAVFGEIAHPVPLPNYPWDEAEYFPPMTSDGYDAWGERSTGALAGRRVDTDMAVWTAEFTPTAPAWVADHVVGGTAILPATALFEVALSAARDLWPETALDLADFDILLPAELGAEGIRIRTTIDETTCAVELQIRPRLEDVAWAVLARGTFHLNTPLPNARLPKSVPWTGGIGNLYGQLEQAGLSYGPAFRRLEDVAPSGRKRVRCRLKAGTGSEPFCLDPMTLDAAFHALGAMGAELPGALGHAMGQGAVLVPVRLRKLRWAATTGQIHYADVTLRRIRQRSASIDVALFDEGQRVIATLEGVELALIRPLSGRKIPARAWTRRRTLWRAPDAPVALPRGWANPQRALERLGMRAEPTPQAGQSRLSDLKQALVAGEDTDVILQGIVQSTPDVVNDARLLLAKAHGAPTHALMSTTARHRARAQVADQLLGALVRTWRADQRLNLCFVGLPDPQLVATWAEVARVDALTLCPSAPDGLEELRATLPLHAMPLLREAPLAGSADVIVVFGPSEAEKAITKAAAPQALVLELDAETDAQGGRFTVVQDTSVRVDATRRGKARRGAPVAIAPLEPLPQDLSFPEELLGPVDSAIPALVVRHEAGASASATLASLILQTKTVAERHDRLMLLVWNAGGAGFAAVMRAAASVLRSLHNEYPDLTASLIAVERPPAAALWPALLMASATEPVLYVDGAEVRLDRVIAKPKPALSGRAAALVAPFAGEPPVWHSAPRLAPRDGQVEVEVCATGLNFRDVLWAQGRIPDWMFDLGASAPGMGMEFSGTVTRVGRGAKAAIGQRVMGFASAAFGSHLILAEAALIPVPDAVPLTHAAGLPVAFTTAWDSLTNVARLRPRERVLIHGAAGGVGMAAVQVARHIGAEVFATAGSADKRALVAALGADHVFDSRDLGFAEGIARATNGHGVDVVLNSLSGKAMERSLSCLAPFGRFVELGKRDFLESTRIDLRPFLRNLSYLSYDLDQRLAADANALAPTLRDIGAGFASGALSALPTTVFDARATGEALRHMQSSLHVGKLVVTPPKLERGKPPRKVFGTWVLLGGTGGVGLALAHALRARGAEQVHLVSRSGELPLGSGADGRAATADRGIVFHAADASDTAGLAEVLAKIETPVTGIVHAAVTLRDRLIKDVDPVELGTVIGSKLGVAESLDQTLRALNITPQHVLFLSSVAAFLGNPGQVAYAAANAGMEAIAEQRRADGLAGAVLALAPIRDKGVLARDAVTLGQISGVQGLDLISVDQAVAAILATLTSPQESDGLWAPLVWRDLLGLLPALARPGFETVVSRFDRDQTSDSPLPEELRRLSWPRALQRTHEELRDILSQIMRAPVDQIDPSLPLSRSGIDSLMAMELRLEVERRFGMALPVASFTDKTTAADLSIALLRKLREDAP